MDDTADEIELSRMLSGALGRVVQAASSLESELRTVAAALLDTKYAAVVVAGQPANWLLDTIQAVAKVHDRVSEQSLLELQGVSTRIKKALEGRNRLAHGVWGTDSDGSVVSHTSRYRRIHWEKTPVTLTGLQELASEMLTLTTSLHLWVMNALPPEASSNEVQLRWEDYLRSLPPEELLALVQRRLNGTP
ncbi:hypothetical protein [Kitasatospora sp. NBC_00315]|uniref:hypothetical protein n=1 Tax=Kitasatospora sp. NBC_00315 TaxID=2975963 RepID=UPI0032480AC3